MSRGTLYVVATPIGNVGDITQRALSILGSCDLILAEDTRNTKKLLENFDINTRCTAVHDHNERDRINDIAHQLDQGNNLSLVSDAGTPLISDPGYPLVSSLREMGYSIVPVPGVSAVTTALSVSGLPTDRFCFEGFLSSKSSARQQRLKYLATEDRTMIFYEAPHRILAMVQDVAAIFGEDRKMSLCRELTKTFETIWTGTAAGLVEFIESDNNQQKGEAVVVVSGREVGNKTDDLTADDEHLLRILLSEMPLKTASVLAAKYTGKSKKAFYNWGLSQKE